MPYVTLEEAAAAYPDFAALFGDTDFGHRVFRLLVQEEITDLEGLRRRLATDPDGLLQVKRFGERALKLAAEIAEAGMPPGTLTDAQRRQVRELVDPVARTGDHLERYRHATSLGVALSQAVRELAALRYHAVAAMHEGSVTIRDVADRIGLDENTVRELIAKARKPADDESELEYGAGGWPPKTSS